MRFTHLRVRYRSSRKSPLGALSAARDVSAPALATPVWRPPCDLTESAAGWTRAGGAAR